MNYSIILKSQLENNHRLDAEYYQSQYMEIRNILLDKFSGVKLEKLISAQVVTGSTPTQRDCRNDGTDIPFIKTDTVREGVVNFAFADYMPLKASIENSKPKAKDILVTIIGATQEIVGRAAFVYEDYPDMNINQNIARIRTGNTLNPYFLEAFLRGKYGRYQLWQQSRQTEQVNLNCREVEQIIIPQFNEDIYLEIQNLMTASRTAVIQSQEYYAQAENILLKTLGLINFQSESTNSCIVNLSDVQSVNRIDADYFQPKYAELIDRLKKFNSTPLTTVINNISAKFNPLAHPDQQFRYVELADIDSTIGIINNCSEMMGKEAPSRAKRLLKEGDVIVSSVEGSLNKTALVEKQYDGSLASTGFFQFRSNKFLPEVILIMAKSMVLQMQLTRECAGTILTAVPKESLNRILVPEVEDRIQKEIASLVKESHLARQKSKELLEQAKKTVEEMIEKRGDNI
ncbi:hypothetical protein COZ41_02455 [Candidatus Shapirobacteria bacterium CG_4_10_14_3_um_filter_35_13]|uniref:Type I restriction modification DNA specificity domain-containing protein n=1 Tax=Candidatus Shapirobacteria bacterium CG_4_10_14_3_um_filter_35_13 TaxID=1974873 RepID=A0A2M7LIL6_9BACT|nr:MAG: hypothetical protein COZ41_02455 [Candidatus Shapirobacteria bacterium CG_4_10_14_3_um_filter_35_13]